MSSYSPRRVTGLGALAALSVLGALLAVPAPAHAYIGPGAGFALLSSFMVIFATAVLAIVALLIWPFRTLYRLIRHRNKSKPRIKRLIIVGLDGQDPKITDRLLEQGRLPNFQRLADMGCYHRLATTYPSVSPVAWSSFTTGTHPAKHNIFDFLDRDHRSYLPVLSSTRIGSVDRFLNVGRYRIPLRKPEITLLRKSIPFWKVLGLNNVWSTILRVPITFPPDKFRGAQLGAMCIPDLLGTQGTFLLFTTRPSGEKFKEGGIRIPLEAAGNGKGTGKGDTGSGDLFETKIEGPENMFLEGQPPLEIPLTIRVDRAAGKVHLRVGEEERSLAPRELSDWIPLTFPAAPLVKVSGLCRMMVTEMGEHVSLYVTPLNIDPAKPAMPISHPSYYSTYLAKKVGPYGTLGLAEDTWALNEKVTDDATFLKQAYDFDDERQAMFFAALDKLRSGALVCVFDATDRIQHMFWRYLRPGHPAAPDPSQAEHKDAIVKLYERNDVLIGKVLDRLKDGDMMMVCSDHGFTSFRRGVNLNVWLHQNGYLALKEGTDGSAEWLRDVDWSKTRAYCVGLTGMFLNLAGREGEGIVQRGEEAEALKVEIIGKLNGLRDEQENMVAVNEIFDSAKQYQGPYVADGPDLLLGFNHGYRISWDCASGMVSGPVFEDNVKAWSGDHCVDPRIVPGVFFCNRPIDDPEPALMDIAPTALELFGIEPPAHMDGKTLFDMATFNGKGPGNGKAKKGEAS